MDVTPNGSVSDTIRLYSGTGEIGSETWTLLYTKVLLGSAAGYQQSSTNPKNGFSGYGSSDQSAFLDDYRVFVTDTV